MRPRADRPMVGRFATGNLSAALTASTKTYSRRLGQPMGATAVPTSIFQITADIFYAGSIGVGRDPDAASRSPMAPGGGNSGPKVGSVQASAFQNHAHETTGVFLQADGGTGFTGAGFDGNSGNFPSGQQNKQYGTSQAINGSASSETRPVNAYVNCIIKL